VLVVRSTRTIAAPLLFLSLAGCEKLHDPSTISGPAIDPMAPIDVDELARDVAAARGLPLKHSVEARALSDTDFAFHFLAASDDRSPTRREVDGALWQGFGFAASGTSPRDAAHRAVESSVVGLYDRHTKKLYVRGAHGGGARIVPSRSSDRYVLVHEIEHALQDQNFGLEDGMGISEDEALARRALVEGDARLTEIGARARDLTGDDRWASRATYWLHNQSLEDILRNQGVSGAELLSAPSLVRRRFMFPYVEGAAFTGDLVRAGGLRLVDQAFAHPPRSTEQVLHPQKYVDGDLPVPVAPPEAPEGWGRVAWGSLGELATAVLLAQCEPSKRADADATGWGGDAWAMVVSGPNKALLWSTVWDDAPSAARFERAAAGRGSCLAKAQIDPGLGRDVLVLRDEKRVAYVQGLPEPLRESAARALLALPGDPPPAAVPLGHVVIPTQVDPYRSFAHQGEYESGTWTSEPLGVAMQVPEGFKAADPGVYEAAMRDDSSAGFAAFYVVFQPMTEKLRGIIVRQLVPSLREDMHGRLGLLSYTGDHQTPMAGGTAHDYHWQWSVGVRLDVLFLPACSGKGAVVVVTAYSSHLGQEATDRWLKAFHLPAPASPACLWLRDTETE
jgi:hypothetical protein